MTVKVLWGGHAKYKYNVHFKSAMFSMHLSQALGFVKNKIRNLGTWEMLTIIIIIILIKVFLPCVWILVVVAVAKKLDNRLQHKSTNEMVHLLKSVSSTNSNLIKVRWSHIKATMCIKLSSHNKTDRSDIVTMQLFNHIIKCPLSTWRNSHSNQNIVREKNMIQPTYQPLSTHPNKDSQPTNEQCPPPPPQ